MATVNIIGLYEPNRVSFAQNVIPNPQNRKFITIYFLIEGSTTKIGPLDKSSYVPLHIPMDTGIANAVKIGDVIVTSPNGTENSIGKYNFTLNKNAACHVFQHLISNGTTQKEYVLKLLSSGVIGSFIIADNTIIQLVVEQDFELNGTDTKPPCQKPTVLQQ